MLALERRHALADLLADEPILTVGDLARRFGVSTQTIRRDFQYLAQRGLITRAYGGAVARGALPLSREGPFSAREVERAEQKRAIAHVALGLVAPGSTVIFDASTTVLALARALPLDSDVTAIVSALPVAMELARRPRMTTILLGGTLRPASLSAGGPMAETAMGRLFADTAFISARGLSAARGLTEANPHEAALKGLMIAHAARVVALVDSSKLDQTALCVVAPSPHIDILITDAGADPATLDQLRAAGLDVRCAPA